MEIAPEQKASEDNFLKLLWVKFRSELLGRPLFYFLLFIGFLFLGALFYWPIRVTKYGRLTDLEQLLFQIFLVVLSWIISWALAKKEEEKNVLAKQKALARSAVRRISGIGSAAARMSEIIETRKASVKSAPEWVSMDEAHRSLFYELFDGLSRQVTEMRDNIAASEGDWRDILPEEFAKKEQAEREILLARERAIEDIEKANDELQKALIQGEARTSEQITALKEGLAKQLAAVEQRLLVNVEKIQSQLPSPVSTATYGSQFAYGLQPLSSLVFPAERIDPQYQGIDASIASFPATLGAPVVAASRMHAPGLRRHAVPSVTTGREAKSKETKELEKPVQNPSKDPDH